MNCMKTGCHVYLKNYGEYLYGDAFESADNKVALFRIVERSRKPLFNRLHYTIEESSQWFDKDKEGATSTLIAFDFKNHGYEGKEIK